MKLNTLRYLDRKIGIPLCYAVYFLKKALFLHGRHKFEKEKVKKILVIKIYGMGSIILASPVFQNLRQNFPNAEIWFLTQTGMDKIYPALSLSVRVGQAGSAAYKTPFFNRIETIKLKGFTRAIKDFFKLIIKLRREKFDLSVDLEIVSRYTALLSYLCGAKTKVGFEIMGQNKDKLYDIKAIYHEGKHISKVFLSALEAAGLEIFEFPFQPPEFSKLDEEAVERDLLSKNITRPYVILNINASELSYERRLPLSYFKSAIDYINKNFSEYCVALAGSPNERGYIENFIKKYLSGNKKVFNLAGNSLTELFAFISGAKLMVSNDSGPAHIAAAFGVPTIVFFGPESPVIYGHNSKNVKNFYKEVHCSPCLSVYKDKKYSCVFNQQCLNKFSEEEINSAIREFLPGT